MTKITDINLPIQFHITTFINLRDFISLSLTCKHFLLQLPRCFIVRHGDHKDPCSSKIPDLRLISRIYKKNLIVISNFGLQSDNDKELCQRKDYKLFHGLPIISFMFSKTFFSLRTIDNSVLFHQMSLLKNQQGFHIGKLNEYSKLNCASDYSIAGCNVLYLDGLNLMCIFPGFKFPLCLNFELKIFNENFSGVRKFWCNELFLIIQTSNNGYFLILNGFDLEQVISNRFEIFKIEMPLKVHKCLLSLFLLIVLDENGCVYELALDKQILAQKFQEYTVTKHKNNLILQPTPSSAFKEKKIIQVFTNGYLFVLQEEIRFRKLCDFSVKEVQDFFLRIGLKKCDKTILYSEIDGSKLENFTFEDYVNILGLRQNGSDIIKLKEEISILKSKSANFPNLFAYGKNYNRQFGLDTNLNYAALIERPMLRTDERIEKIEVSLFSTIICTDKKRFFGSVSRQVTPAFKQETEKEEPDKEKKKRNSGGKEKKKQAKPKAMKKKDSLKIKNEGKFYWVDLLEFVNCGSSVKSRHETAIENVFCQGKFVNILAYDNYGLFEANQERFKKASEALDFIKFNMDVDREDLLFLCKSRNKFIEYTEYVGAMNKQWNITLIKKKSSNKVIWSTTTETVDIKALLQSK